MSESWQRVASLWTVGLMSIFFDINLVINSIEPSSVYMLHNCVMFLLERNSILLAGWKPFDPFHPLISWHKWCIGFLKGMCTGVNLTLNDLRRAAWTSLLSITSLAPHTAWGTCFGHFISVVRGRFHIIKNTRSSLPLFRWKATEIMDIISSPYWPDLKYSARHFHCLCPHHSWSKRGEFSVGKLCFSSFHWHLGLLKY